MCHDLWTRPSAILTSGFKTLAWNCGLYCKISEMAGENAKKKSLPEITGFSIGIPECSLQRFNFIAYSILCSVL